MFLSKVKEMQQNDSDISSHYGRLYQSTLKANPKLIVELGVSQKGDSSRIFSLVNDELDSHVIGVDQVDCPYGFVTNGIFVKRDDIAFASDFPSLCTQPIDVLFVDTSHEYIHTKREISAWFPLMNSKATIMFHDTNLMPQYFRENGSQGVGWDNKRGVIRAIEEFFETKFDETKYFNSTLEKDNLSWNIEHWPLCNGFTCIHRSLCAPQN